jgi:transposase InsO family protein
VTFRWIRDHREELRGIADVGLICRTLGVSRPGYYAWAKRPASGRDVRRRELLGRIRAAHAASRGTYGSPRVAVELKACGVRVCENTVARYMRQDGLKVKPRRRFVPRTTDSAHPHPVGPNVLDRDFAAGPAGPSGPSGAADGPDRKWCCDLTYIRTDEGWLYLWVVIDLFSRRVIGWSMSDHTRAEAAAAALTMALQRRRPKRDGTLLHHSDRGVQYACAAYRDLLAAHGIASSMSRRGNCYDNAVAESFFGTFKSELAEREHYATREQARRSIFEWIECWYNRRRRHSSLGYVSPEAFEARLN